MISLNLEYPKELAEALANNTISSKDENSMLGFPDEENFIRSNPEYETNLYEGHSEEEKE